MTAVGQWFRKDVRRLALWLAAWTVVLAVRVVNAVGGTTTWMQQTAIDHLATAVTTVLFVLVAVLAVHEDPPADVRGFWMTRAVSGRQVVAAKCLLVGLLLVLPATAVDVTDIAAIGVPPRIVALAVPEVLLEWTAWGAATIALAAVTTSVPGFLGIALVTVLVCIGTWGVIGLGGYLLYGNSMLVYGLQTWWMPSLMRLFHGPEAMAAMVVLEGWRALVVATVMALLGALIAERAWALRRSSAPRVGWFVGIVMVALVWPAWPWLVGQSAIRVPHAEAPATRTVQVTLDPVGIPEPTGQDQAGAPSQRMTIRGRFVTNTGNPTHVADVVRVVGTLSYPDGSGFQASGTGSDNPFHPTWGIATVERLLDGAQIVNVSAAERDGAFPLLKMPVEQFAVHQKHHGRLDIRAGVALRRYEMTAVVPLKPGARFRRDGEDFVVETTTVQDDMCAVQARGAHVSLWVAPDPPRIVRMLFFRMDPSVLWVLRNPHRREALLPDQGMAVGFGWPAHARVDKITWVLSYSSPRGLGDAWLRDAELVRIDVQTDDEVYEPVVIPAFAIDPAAGPPPPLSSFPPLPEGAPRSSDAVRRS